MHDGSGVHDVDPDHDVVVLVDVPGNNANLRNRRVDQALEKGELVEIKGKMVDPRTVKTDRDGGMDTTWIGLRLGAGPLSVPPSRGPQAWPPAWSLTIDRLHAGRPPAERGGLQVSDAGSDPDLSFLLLSMCPRRVDGASDAASR